jgi:integrase
MDDLFDAEPETVLGTYHRAFERWSGQAVRAGTLRSDESLAVLRTMWTALTRWAVAQHPPVAMDLLTAQDLVLFLSKPLKDDHTGRDLSARYAWRMLRLIDRVTAHDARLEGRAASTAVDEVLQSHPHWRLANVASLDPAPDYLSAVQAKALVNHLSQARPRPGRHGPDHTWQESRNRSMVAVQLGAGLTPAEVRALTLASVVVDGGPRRGIPWKLVVAAHGTAPQRETPIAAWAAQVLAHWLEVRAQAQIPPPHLFPSTRSGKPIGKAAHYDAVGLVMAASGLDPSLVAGGSFRLRHTFALRQLRRGHEPAEVARWLGIQPQEMGRYRRVVSAPVIDLA